LAEQLYIQIKTMRITSLEEILLRQLKSILLCVPFKSPVSLPQIGAFEANGLIN